MEQRGADGPAALPARSRRQGREPRSGKGEESRERILDAGEKLFARDGFHAVTVRAITREAGCDVALAHYYFGTKRALFDAVFLRRAEILNRDRIASIDRYMDAAGPAATVEGIIAAFIDPVMDIWQDGGPGWTHYFALVAQVNNTPQWGGETMARYFDPVIQRLIRALRQVMPAARDEDLYWCYQFLSGTLTLAFAQTGRIDRLSDGLCRSTDVAAVRRRMPPYVAAGFRAVCLGEPPVSPAPS